MLIGDDASLSFECLESARGAEVRAGRFFDLEGAAPSIPEVIALRLTDLLTADRVKVPLECGEKEGVLDELVDVVARSLAAESQRGAIARAVREREEVLSTGIGEGVALPHAKFNGIAEMVMAAGVSRYPIEYGALDGRPVRLFFLLLGPEETAGAQVVALSRIGRLLRDAALRERLESAADSREFLQILEASEGVV